MLFLLFAILIGLLLGITGGGGSILAVPVLVYLLHIPVIEATGYSLFIVGITSLVGVVAYAKRKLINYQTAILFSIPSVISVYIVRRFLLPVFPEFLIKTQQFEISKPTFLMLLFALLMLGAAYSMITSKCDMQWEEEIKIIKYNYFLIIIEGITIGTLSALVGAGGGFLIVPSLVILSRLPMKMAIGTSLVVITAQSLIGFLGEMQTGIKINWTLLLEFSGFTFLGMLAGLYFAKKINACQLRKGFGYFVVFMSILIITIEFFFR